MWLSHYAELVISQRQREGIVSKVIYTDEQETIEHTKLKPLSIATAVNENYEILSAKVASMPSKGKIAKISREKYGYRVDDRPKAMKQLMQELKLCTPKNHFYELVSDAKPSYKIFLRKSFPGVTHKIFVSRKTQQPDLLSNKKKWDPLFPLNQRFAKLRADIRRLTRKSWCTTKKSENLQRQLNIYICHNNNWVNS